MHQRAPSPPLFAIGLISAAALAYEILLTRIFAMVHWHHLVAIAIALALLGYGASGSFLALAGRHLRARPGPAFVANAILFSVSAVACVSLAQRLPFDPQALSWDGHQVLYLAATFLVLAAPFFAAANCIGLALWQFTADIPRLYGADLIGAGSGAFLVLLGLALVSPANALAAIFFGGMLAAAAGAWSLRWQPVGVAVVALLLGVSGLLYRPAVEPAPYKDLARALGAYGAQTERELSGAPGVVTLVRNDAVPLRYAPGLSLHSDALPPPQSGVFVDGDAAGTLVESDDDAASRRYFRDLVSALPYEMRPVARVAVLNAGTGGRVLQAIAFDAAEIIAVEPNPLLFALTCGDDGAAVPRAQCDRARWTIQGARAFLAGSGQAFDLISIGAESDPAGLDALRLDFDLTREAFTGYLAQLTDDGMLAIEGTARVPPRLSLRLLGTARDALHEAGVDQPAMHLAMLRGWQRFVLLVSRNPLTLRDEQRVRDFAARQGFDLVWLPHIQAQDANRFQQLSEPLFYRGAADVLAASPAAASADAPYRMAAATDDRPFPMLSTRWPEWRAALLGGDRMALAQLDAGLLIATLTLALAVLASLLLITLPLLFLDRRGPPPRAGQRARTLSYFGLLGIAFLFLELGWIQRLQLFLGHPVYATTAVLAAFLIFAGLGSLWSQRGGLRGGPRRLRFAVGAILGLSLLYLWFVPDWLAALGGLPLGMRVLVALLLLAPLAFVMGVPFPTGLQQLGDASPVLIPWAWGINGCTSVISAATAPLLAAEIGFAGLTLLAVGAYLLLPLIQLRADPR